MGFLEASAIQDHSAARKSTAPSFCNHQANIAGWLKNPQANIAGWLKKRANGCYQQRLARVLSAFNTFSQAV
jgi:hypothetical protein